MASELSASRSIAARSLEPFAAGLWILFWIWTAFTAGLWASGVGEAELKGWLRNEGLLAALTWIVGWADCMWMILAAANVYAAEVSDDGLATARRRAGGVMLVTALVGAASVLTTYPLGPIHYTTRLGMKLGPVPLAMPLLWFVIIIGGHELSLRLFPRASHARVALATAAFTHLTYLSLAPVAWRIRAFWLWRFADGREHLFEPALANVTWTLVAFSIALEFRERKVGREPSQRSWRPILVYGALHVLLGAARLSGVLESIRADYRS